jgi:hypothetical protein
MIKSLLTNWRTTSAGLIMIIGSVVHLVYAVLEETATESTWTVSLTAIVGGIGLMFARDTAAAGNKVAEIEARISTVENNTQTFPKP